MATAAHSSYLSYALLGLVMAGALQALFFMLELRSRRDVIIWIILGEAILETILYPNQAAIESPLFYLPLAGRHVRPAEILITMALFARAAVTTKRSRWTLAGGAWAAFFAWYCTEFLLGLVNHNPRFAALFDLKQLLLFLGGSYLLTAGVPIAQLTGRRAIGRWLAWLGPTILALIPFSHGLSLSLDFSLLPLSSISYGADASDCVVALGALFLAIELCRPDPRPRAAGIAMVLILSSLVGTQRAAMLVTGGVFGVFIAAVLVAKGLWTRRTSFATRSLRRLAAASSAVGAIALAGMAAASIPNPLSQRIHQALFSTGKAESANARLQIWREAFALISQRPAFGHGLGIQVPLRQVWPMPVIMVPTHDLVLDLLLRSGIVGLALFVFALVLFFRQGITVWRLSAEPLTAAAALGAMAGIVGLLALSGVESLFDQVRIAITFGFLFGVLTSASRAYEAEGARGDLSHQEVLLPGLA